MNVSHYLKKHATERPSSAALIVPKKTLLSFLWPRSQKTTTYTFFELHQRSNLYAHGLKTYGLTKGMRVLVFLKPGLEFINCIFALFKMGCIPVFIDPGMGVENMLNCIHSSGAQALIGIPKIHHLKLLKSASFSHIEIFIVVEGKAIGAVAMDKIIKGAFHDDVMEELAPHETCAVLFTSGGTGIPKGVIYTHEMFCQQVKVLKQIFKLNLEERDYPCFPLFGLFSLALGMKVYIPSIDLLKPASVKVKPLVRELISHEITFATGSPALWDRVAQYCIKKKIKLPQLRSVVMFGAPVSIKLHQQFAQILVGGDTYTPYGATESLPVSCISGREILGETFIETERGHGTCVGYPVPGVAIKILSLQNTAIDSELTHLKEASEGEMGEIIVLSKQSTPGYDFLTEATLHSKVADNSNLWHRMGDVGYLDSWGRLWFCGRRSHLIEYQNTFVGTEELEPLVNKHPLVMRSALVLWHGKPAMVIERKDGLVDLPEVEKKKFVKEIFALLHRSEKGQLVVHVVLHHHFPVDTRHNIKIDRPKLAQLISAASGLDLAGATALPRKI